MLPKQIEKIVELEFAGVSERLIARGISVNLSDRAKKYPADASFDPQFGARPLTRTMKKMVTDELANRILAGVIKEGDFFDRCR